MRLRVVGSPAAAAVPAVRRPFVVQKVTKAGTRIRCLNEGCGYTADAESPEANEAPAPAPTGTG